MSSYDHEMTASALSIDSDAASVLKTIGGRVGHIVFLVRGIMETSHRAYNVNVESLNGCFMGHYQRPVGNIAPHR